MAEQLVENKDTETKDDTKNEAEKEIKKETKPKKVVWIYDKDQNETRIHLAHSYKCYPEQKYSFKLQRYKDTSTFRELLVITNFVTSLEKVDPNTLTDSSLCDEELQTVENGTIETSLPNLTTDINQFREYGVAMGLTYFRDLAKQIELHYVDIPVTVLGSSGDSQRFDSLIDSVKEYFLSSVNSDGSVTVDFCYIPVKMFQQLSEDCGYRPYEMQSLRKRLDEGGYIHTVSKRYTLVRRIDKKPERVIAFKKETLFPEGIGKKDTDEK